MRFYPQGVSVLSVEREGESMGVTISSLISISLDPPLVGVSIGKQASCYELLRRAGSFGVSLLGAAQAAVAQRFASGFPPLVHWQGIETRRGPAGVAPLLAEARGWLECRVRDELCRIERLVHPVAGQRVDEPRGVSDHGRASAREPRPR